MTWHLGRMAAFDLETTAPDPETARTVTACVALVGGGQPSEPHAWLADPGVEIPEEAAAVHGVSTEQARAEGRPAAEVVAGITATLADALADGTPVVAMNARYDLTVLDRECRRYGIPTLTDRCATVGPVIDPLVLDKQVDRYRRGSRTLSALCAHYGVPLDAAHDSAADAVAAAQVAWRIGATVPELAAMSLAELHQAQVTWAREQADGLAAYFRRTPGKAHLAETVRGQWPLLPAREMGAAAADGGGGAHG